MATKTKKVLAKDIVHKAQFSVGFKVQVEQYEPVDIWAGESVEYTGEIKDIDVKLIKAVMKRLGAKVEDIVLHVGELKQRIIDELSNPEDS